MSYDVHVLAELVDVFKRRSVTRGGAQPAADASLGAVRLC